MHHLHLTLSTGKIKYVFINSMNRSAIKGTLLPVLPLERFKQVGNAAGTGARLALISQSQRAAAQKIAQQDGYIELAGVPNFNRKFAEATYL